MICQKNIARCYRAYQHERNENAFIFVNFQWRWEAKEPLSIERFVIF